MLESVAANALRIVDSRVVAVGAINPPKHTDGPSRPLLLRKSEPEELALLDAAGAL